MQTHKPDLYFRKYIHNFVCVLYLYNTHPTMIMYILQYEIA